jgi:hypothetical protein
MCRLFRLALIAFVLSAAIAPGASLALSLCKQCQQEGSGR